MILIKRFKLFVHAKIEKKVGLPKYSLILFGGFNKKNRSFTAEITLDTFCMPGFLDLHQQYSLFCKKN